MTVDSKEINIYFFINSRKNFFFGSSAFLSIFLRSKQIYVYYTQIAIISL